MGIEILFDDDVVHPIGHEKSDRFSTGTQRPHAGRGDVEIGDVVHEEDAAPRGWCGLASGSSHRRACRRCSPPSRSRGSAGSAGTFGDDDVGERPECARSRSRRRVARSRPFPRIRHRRCAGEFPRAGPPACPRSRWVRGVRARVASASRPGTSGERGFEQAHADFGARLGGGRLSRGLGAGIRRTESRRRAARSSRASRRCAQCTGIECSAEDPDCGRGVSDPPRRHDVSGPPEWSAAGGLPREGATGQSATAVSAGLPIATLLTLKASISRVPVRSRAR